MCLYVYDILIASKSMEEINMLKDQHSRTFDMKDLETEKHISGMEIHRDRKNGKLGYHSRSMWKEYLKISI